MDDELHNFTEGYDLVIPFVNVQSLGGKFDDESYSAGWEMGKLDAQVAAALPLGLLPVRSTIRRDNLHQADLIAMHHQLVLIEEPWDDDVEGGIKTEWAIITIDCGHDAHADE